MQTITLDLKKEPDIAALVADMQPGDPVTLHTTVKAKDDQTLTLTLEEAEEGEPHDDMGGQDEAENAPEEAGGADMGAPRTSADIQDQAGNGQM